MRTGAYEDHIEMVQGGFDESVRWGVCNFESSLPIDFALAYLCEIPINDAYGICYPEYLTGEQWIDGYTAEQVHRCEQLRLKAHPYSSPMDFGVFTYKYATADDAIAMLANYMHTGKVKWPFIEILERVVRGKESDESSDPT
jgi:hypothetical protein